MNKINFLYFIQISFSFKNWLIKKKNKKKKKKVDFKSWLQNLLLKHQTDT